MQSGSTAQSRHEVPMKDLTPAQEAPIEPPTCDHAPVCVEWHAMHGVDDYGPPQV